MADPLLVDVRRSYWSDDGTDMLNFYARFSAEVAPATGDGPYFELLYRWPPTTSGKPGREYKQSEVASGADYPPDSTTAEEWEVITEQKFYSGEMILRIKWRAASDGKTREEEHSFTAGNTLNAQQDVHLPNVAPELGKAINEVKPLSGKAPTSTDVGGQILDILRHVYDQLSYGLGPIWRSFEGLPTKNGQAVSEVAEVSALDNEELEECWAQQISEWLVGTAYAGPGSNYISGGSDSEVFAFLVSPTEPAYPILCACQQLCSVASISRGFDDCVTQMIDSHNPPGAANMKKWTTGVGAPALIETNAAYCEAVQAIGAGVLRPGTVYVKAGLPHAAFVLRVLRAAQLQLIDTSAMQTVPPHESPFPISPGALSSGMNYDTVAANEVTKSGFTHLGVVTQASRLREGIERMRLARPIGLARLVILNRDGASASDVNARDRLRWASALVPMWERNKPNANYSITRYMWSLRDHPHRELFEARWLLDIPQDLYDPTKKEWTRRMFSRVAGRPDGSDPGPRGRAFCWTDAERNAATIPPRARTHATMDVASKSDGQMQIVGRFSEKADNQYNNLLRAGTPESNRRVSVFQNLPIGVAEPKAAPPGNPSDPTARPNVVVIDKASANHPTMARYLWDDP